MATLTTKSLEAGDASDYTHHYGEKHGETATPSITSEFSDQDTKRLVRKIDLHLLPILCILYVCCSLDRSNIGNAKLFGLEADLNLSQSDYSWALSIFYIGYVIFEIPSNMMIKRIRPSTWLSVLVLGWGTICMCMAANSGAPSLLVLRFLLGVAEAGFFPGVVYFFSFWYSGTEIATRVAIFYGSSSIAGASGGLIAYGIGHMDGRAGLDAWRWLFLIEGMPTIVMGLVVYFFLADGPLFAPWLNDTERTHAIQRLERNKFTETNIHAIDWQEVRDGFKDYRIYLLALNHIALVVPAYSMSFLLPTVIKGLGYDTLESQLLTVPLYAFSAMVTVGAAISSDRRRERSTHIALVSAMGVLGFLLVTFLENTVAKYVLLLLALAGSNATAAINLAWASNNTLGKTKQGISSGLILMVGNAGGIISGQMYRNSEAPRYVGSHMGNTGCLALMVVLSLFMRWILTRDNRRLDAFVREAEADPTLWHDTSRVPKVLQLDRNFRYTL
ncbi:major facilitator superfamily domain-containing protein [Dimargaris cristalligena]|uniref:Major facilitator superfamily domain-containing protein n=1 Tax=Dimargaris cristalligena TaxID=215637 RepID=A0A4P9ZVL8_9FUNG|nr:major facilitator superfamily domain-containing protein [Dimargaris cristalligena]|eukprot:RKP37645.1 major facilitator superfamily domain-containing protein [Dimargaris cristalligena]